MASMRRAVRMGLGSLSRQGQARTIASQQPTTRPSPVRRLAVGSADAELAVADAGEGALGAAAFGAVDEVDGLAVLGPGDGVPAGHGMLDVDLAAGSGDEPDQVGLGGEPLAVAGGVAEQEPGHLGLRVERPML